MGRCVMRVTCVHNILQVLVRGAEVYHHIRSMCDGTKNVQDFWDNVAILRTSYIHSHKVTLNDK